MIVAIEPLTIGSPSVEQAFIGDGRALQAEVVVVELQAYADILVEVSTAADLDALSRGLIEVGIADGQGKAAAAQEEVLAGAIGVGVAPGVARLAVATARRRLHALWRG